VTDLAPYRRAFERLADLLRTLQRSGFAVARLDLGGGLGIRYHRERRTDFAEYAGLVRDVFGGLDLGLELEPGRVLAGPAGVLATQVLCVKDGATRPFVIVDAAMNDLVRPALYDAWHDLVPVRQPQPDTARMPMDVVGPVCETGDTFAADRELPDLAAGDLVAFTEADA
jgi:diaminopimelate decarboxylase